MARQSVKEALSVIKCLYRNEGCQSGGEQGAALRRLKQEEVRMKADQIVSFKDNIYRMFLKYAIVPAFSMAFAGVVLTFLVWGLSTMQTTYRSNTELSEELDQVLVSYQKALEEVAEQCILVTEPITQQTRVKVFEELYGLSNHLGYRAKLYVFNGEYQTVISSTKELPEELAGAAITNWGIFRQMNQQPGQTVMKVVQDSEMQSSSLYLGRTMGEGENVQGYALFVLESAELRTLLDRGAVQTIITDSFGWIYSANNYDFCDNLNRMDRNCEGKQGFVRRGDKSFYMVSSQIADGKLFVYSLSDMSGQLDAFKWIVLLAVFILVIILFRLMKGAEKISVRSTEDIDVIANAFEQVKEGNLDSYIHIKSSREFQCIGESYNLMLDSLKENIEKNREMIAHMAFAQIKQLESQINPHFLFNTLENIRIMCKIDPAKADKMIVSLSALLRYSISNAEEDVTVREDVAITENYLSILKIRFNQRLQYVLDMEEDILDCEIPKLLIQPMIENAIRYGFGDREKLRVEIKGRMEGDDLIFCCRDDGVGIDAKTLEELQYTLTQPKNRSNHLGLYNIHKRIHLKYQGDYGLTIKSKEGEGTALTLRLPGKRKEKISDSV